MGASVWRIGKTLALSLWLCLAAAGQQVQHSIRSIPPGQLVARAIQNELSARGEGSYMYRDQRETPAGVKTKELVETSDGVVARLIAVNNHPLTEQQRAEEEARLRNLLQNPELQRQKQKEQQHDDARVKRMFRELPMAFQYEYEGAEPGPYGELIRLKFAPNPQYQPPSRETSVFKGMAGKIWVHAADCRMAKIEATLFRDVTFGWGILGHLNKGGHFYIEQSKLSPGRWEVTFMNIQFTGKALLFKTIDLRQMDRISNFRRVPDGLTLAQGIELLQKNGSELAENQKNGK